MSLRGPLPLFCHCEALKGPWQSLFWPPYARPYCLSAPEIATSGQKPSLLAMTRGWFVTARLVLGAEAISLFRSPLCLSVLPLGTGDCHVASLLAMTNGGGCRIMHHALLAMTNRERMIVKSRRLSPRSKRLSSLQ